MFQISWNIYLEFCNRISILSYIILFSTVCRHRDIEKQLDAKICSCPDQIIACCLITSITKLHPRSVLMNEITRARSWRLAADGLRRTATGYEPPQFVVGGIQECHVASILLVHPCIAPSTLAVKPRLLEKLDASSWNADSPSELLTHMHPPTTAH